MVKVGQANKVRVNNHCDLNQFMNIHKHIKCIKNDINRIK